MNETGLAERLEAFRTRMGAPAVGAALLAAGDEPVMAVTGVRVRGRSEPASVDDFWHLGSCGKSMAAALAARFVEAGSLAWDSTFPELFGGLDVHPGWEHVTLAQLLTHRAGVPANLTRSQMNEAYADPRPAAEQRAELAARFVREPPGTIGRFRYSNLGYTLVGAALERRTGVPYETLLFDELLNPLGIESGGFGAPPDPHPWGHRPRLGGFGRGPALDPAASALPHPADNPPVVTPAGRLHLTLGEWAKFVRLFLVPGIGFLDGATITTMITPTRGRGTNQAMGWAEAKAPGVSLGQQGSNRAWVATALLSEDRTRAALVTTNDGRTRMLLRSAGFAAELLTR